MLHNRDYMRPDGYRTGWPLWGKLILTLVAIFVFQEVLEFQSRIRNADWHRSFGEWFALSVAGMKSGKIWQLLTFQFLHGGLWHVLGNSIIIFFFGRHIEQQYGSRTFAWVYLTGGVVGGLIQFGLGFMAPDHYGKSVVGASAGAFALLTAFCVLDLRAKITFLLFFIPITVPAWLFLSLAGLVTTIGVLAPNPGDAVAHGAHLGGLIIGYLWVRYYVRANGWSSIPFLRRISLPKIVVKRGSKRSPAAPSQTRNRGGVRIVREDNSDDLPDSEFISKKVDPILEKIRENGIHSLTDQERKILEKAQDKLSGK